MNRAHGLEHLLSFAIEQPWALTRPMLSVIANVLGRRLAASQGEMAEVRAAAAPLPPRRTDVSPAPGIAVIPIHGVIAPRMNQVADFFSGGTSYAQIRNLLHLAVADPSVGTIVLDIDSPGGSCAGATECATSIRAAAMRKPIIAVAEYQMCSAAYWLAAQASEIIASPSASVGSIGVFTIHEDLSKMLEALGITATIVSAGKFKVDANPFEPLSAEARGRLQAQVRTTFGRFVADVAKGRGVTPEAVRGGFGEGAVVTADDALALGMVNAIATLEDTIARVLVTPPRLDPARSLPTSNARALESASRPVTDGTRLAHFQQQQRARTLGARIH